MLLPWKIYRPAVKKQQDFLLNTHSRITQRPSGKFYFPSNFSPFSPSIETDLFYFVLT